MRRKDIIVQFQNRIILRADTLLSWNQAIVFRYITSHITS